MALAEALAEEFATRQVMAAQFPALTRHGIEDEDVTIHSHFLSYLTALAQPLGYSGVVECPVPGGRASRWAKLGDPRPDAIWFTRENNSPVAAFEFERFEPGKEAKLREKVQNLHIAYLQSGRRLQLVVLIYWVRSGVAPQSMQEIVDSYRNAFVRRGVNVPATGCPLRVYKCTWRHAGSLLVVSDIFRVGAF